MPTTRPRLELDEQSFQSLLAAAFTIQEHNEKQGRTSALPSPTGAVPVVRKILEKLCPHCAAPLQPGETVCGKCGLDEFRPGERMQRKFASLWEMIQEQSAHHPPPPESVVELASSFPASLPVDSRDQIGNEGLVEADSFQDFEVVQQLPEFADPQLAEGPVPDDATPEIATVASGPVERLREFWRSLHVPSADLYLGIAILVAVLAILWPTPMAQKSRLRPWQRLLVKVGVAEAPPQQVRYRGDPNVQVWVDPHTALYYCPGEEQYGKSVGGRFAAQREAQMDQFEPAGRNVCQ